MIETIARVNGDVIPEVKKNFNEEKEEAAAEENELMTGEHYDEEGNLILPENLEEPVEELPSATQSLVLGVAKAKQKLINSFKPASQRALE